VDGNIPSTLHDLLSARLDRLGLAKKVLQVGAAIGREFSQELVSMVFHIKPQALDHALERAAAMALIGRVGTGQSVVYRFRHALIQEAAYASLLKSRRRSLHARIAKTAEEHAPGLRGSEPEWLARHYTQAGEAGRAAALWLEAGRRAKNTFATNEATSHLNNCLAVGSSTELRDIRAEALMLLGDLASLSEDLTEADRRYRHALEEAADEDLRRRIENKRHHRKTVVRDGAQIAYYVHGSGDVTLLFVSTQALGMAMFQPILERLCDEFRVVTVDPRGSGSSDPLTRPYLLKEHATDVLAVIAQLAYSVPKACSIACAGRTSVYDGHPVRRSARRETRASHADPR
jgi:pimeloyl-ACP methyl ester carboxylesterase